jgi:hypothetical protein
MTQGQGDTIEAADQPRHAGVADVDQPGSGRHEQSDGEGGAYTSAAAADGEGKGAKDDGYDHRDNRPRLERLIGGVNQSINKVSSGAVQPADADHAAEHGFAHGEGEHRAGQSEDRRHVGDDERSRQRAGAGGVRLAPLGSLAGGLCGHRMCPG